MQGDTSKRVVGVRKKVLQILPSSTHFIIFSGAKNVLLSLKDADKLAKKASKKVALNTSKFLSPICENKKKEML